jgi:hypothetical protein
MKFGELSISVYYKMGQDIFWLSAFLFLKCKKRFYATKKKRFNEA